MRQSSKIWAITIAILTVLTILPTNSGAAPISTGSTHNPLVIIGVDGMTFDAIRPLVANHQLPNIAKMMQRGATAVLQSENPMRSPALWTTIATGQPRAKHGIYDFVTASNYWPRHLRHGPQALVTSDMRASPALWQWAERGGQRSLIVGWLNTWPAEQIDGVIVAPYVALGQPRQTSIKGRIYEDVDRQTWPVELFSDGEDGIVPLIVATSAISDAQIADIVDVPASTSELYSVIPQLRRYLYTVRWSIASSLTNTAILEKQLRQRKRNSSFGLVMTYFDGSDTLAHRFWIFRQALDDIRARLTAHGIDPTWAAELKRRLGGAVDGYYRLIDQMVGRISKAAGDDATIMLVSDHGWGDLSTGDKAPHDHVPFEGEHRPDGILIVHGPDIRRGEYSDATLYDVAPTALYLMGLRPPDEMPGNIMAKLTSVAFQQQHRKTIVAGRAQPPGDVRSPAATPPKTKAELETPFREQELERLRSLGYVQ